jgi:hypothetical protein
VALVTSVKSDFAVVTGEALSVAAVVGNGNQPLLPGLKQLRACRRQARVAIHAHVALGGVHAMVEGDGPLSATPVIECPYVLTNRGQAEEDKQQADERRSTTHRKASHKAPPRIAT